MYLTLAPETAVYCIPAVVQRKGPRFPGNVCPEWKMRTKLEAEEEEKEEEDSHVGAWDREIQLHRPGQERKQRLGSPRQQLMPPEAQGWCPWGRVAMVSSDAAHRHQPISPPVAGTVADALETKPVCLLWFVFTHLETPGKWNPGVIPCHYVLLLKATKVYFSVTQWRHTPERRGVGGKQRHRDRNLCF